MAVGKTPRMKINDGYTALFNPDFEQRFDSAVSFLPQERTLAKGWSEIYDQKEYMESPSSQLKPS